MLTKMEKYLLVFSNSETPPKKTTTSSSQNPEIVKSSPVQVNPAEVTDEFAPDASEDSIENVTESEPVKMKTFSICDNNHWVHLFSDTDVNVECILTEQVCDLGNLMPHPSARTKSKLSQTKYFLSRTKHFLSWT